MGKITLIIMVSVGITFLFVVVLKLYLCYKACKNPMDPSVQILKEKSNVVNVEPLPRRGVF